MELFGETLSATFDALVPILEKLAPLLWWVIPVVLAVRIFFAPMPGRGPSNRERDPWRGFRFAQRTEVLERAGGRCEATAFLLWGRCSDPATEVDHVFPHSKGGPTIPSNGQALCSGHNRSKSSLTPPWWYTRSLEKRRRGYFPTGTDVRVSARMSPEDRELRRAWAARQPRSRRW